MKIFYKIYIIFFLSLCLFIIRDDIKLTFNHVVEYISNYNDNDTVIALGEKESIKPTKKVETPGPLTVISDFVNGGSKLNKDNIINLTNNHRTANGNLKLLKENIKLNMTAENKLQDMFNGQYFEHISPKGVGVGDLGEKVGYDYILIGENLAMGNFNNDSGLVDAWMASTGHRANILNGHYTEIGVAVGKGTYEGKSVWMAVQHFGTPINACPIVDPILYGIIELNQKNIQSIEDELLLRKNKIDLKVIYEESTYYEQIDKYNKLIDSYNKLVSDTKVKINNYNEQVVAFNKCLESNE